MEQFPYGQLSNGQAVTGFAMKNANGLEVRCIDYGCRITNILVPGKTGPADVVLGFDDIAGWEDDAEHGGTYQGAFIGRYANRIAHAAFDLDGVHYSLLKNNGENYLHGTLHKKIFTAEVIGDNSVTFTLTSPHGEDGFPGEVWVSVTYTLTDKNELWIDYRAVPNQDTHLNFTNHAYFNLAGGGTIYDHELTLNCGLFLEVDESLIPTGRLLETEGGAFDFSQPKPIGRDINANDPMIALAGGYDHAFVINREQPGLALAATATEPHSGRTLHVYATNPSVQFYAGNSLSGQPGKGGVPLSRHTGFCLETQHYPSSPTMPDFPTTLVRKGEKYRQSTVLQFGWAGGE